MKIKINIKGYSNSTAKIRQLEYEYSKTEYTVKEFLEETVLITLNNYQNNTLASDLYKVLTDEEIRQQSESGKISFGYHYNENKVNKNKAIETALSDFIDGMVALFIGEDRYEDINEKIILDENTVVTFIKLTFLAGRMW